MKTHYWAVFLDETGCEFGAGCYASTRTEAYEKLSESYPESRIVQLESPEDTQRREEMIYADALEEEYAERHAWVISGHDRLMEQSGEEEEDY
jgi:hypothetical protein